MEEEEEEEEVRMREVGVGFSSHDSDYTHRNTKLNNIIFPKYIFGSKPNWFQATILTPFHI